MSPKEWTFFLELLTATAKAAYELGHDDGSSRKPLNIKQFHMSRGTVLRLKTELQKATENR